MPTTAPFCDVEDAIADLRAGKMIVLTDDEDRENEGDLVLPAQFVSPETINFMLSVARGYLCVSMTAEDCDRLELVPQSAVNSSVRATPFTVSVDGQPSHGVGTGVSAADRAKTIELLIDPETKPSDFVRPGHINPLRARDGGVLVRTGQTEGSIDLCRLAGVYPAALIIEIMREDGEMARVPDLEKLCAEHGLKMCSVAQVIEHRLARESLVRRVGETETIETPQGRFDLIAFASAVDPQPHLALTLGGVGALDARGTVIERDAPTLVRMHRRDLLGDVFGDPTSTSESRSTADQLSAAMTAIQAEGAGALVYLRPEVMAPADVNANPARAALIDRLMRVRRVEGVSGAETPDLTRPEGTGTEARVSGSLRQYGIGGQVLRGLGLTKLRLLTNSQRALPGLEAFGLEIVERVTV